ncbi:hypothetical protein M413DRAFT_133208 [Hebeloma cylindrosporum]|uniref:Uncharacterized protein n=1 Tax=Hebeloma cylindrosporum TaxID=76867 RepID=A0A0C3C0I6_HEBCY|nr:hypothetical protein M413DRAFT_133208 [Hebeloma cylindrosporum h7]
MVHPSTLEKPTQGTFHPSRNPIHHIYLSSSHRPVWHTYERASPGSAQVISGRPLSLIIHWVPKMRLCA